MKELYKIKANKDFLERTKLIYMENFRNKFPETQISRRSFRPFALGFAGGVSLMLIISSTAVYADQKDVGADSILYPMKRAYESISLTVASNAEKPLLQLEFAGRRLNEIENIAKESPKKSKEKETELFKDLENSISDSMLAFNGEKENARQTVELSASSTPSAFSAVQEENQINSEPAVEIKKSGEEKPNGNSDKKFDKKNEEEADVCESFNKFFENDSPYLEKVLNENPKYLEKFESKCKIEITDNNKEND